MEYWLAGASTLCGSNDDRPFTVVLDPKGTAISELDLVWRVEGAAHFHSLHTIFDKQQIL